jgi:cytoskeleton protein RodZ
VQLEEEISAQAVTIPVVDDATEAETGADLAAATKKEIEQSQDDLAPVMTDQRVRLSLNFLEESWVEISDAERRLLFGLQREGRRRELTGEPPFELLLGNARGVELRLNDKPYNIPENGITGKVARFAITRAEIE